MVIEPDPEQPPDAPSPLTLREMDSAIKDPSHPRHDEAVKANARLRERMRPISQAILENSGLTKATEAIGRSILASVNPSVMERLGAQYTSGLVVPHSVFEPPVPGPDLTYALAGVDVGAPQRRQLESLERLGVSIGDLVAIVTDDAAAARADAKESARSARHGLIVGWCGVGVAVIIGVVTMIVAVRHGG
jgi:hypothetical protein